MIRQFDCVYARRPSSPVPSAKIVESPLPEKPALERAVISETSTPAIPPTSSMRTRELELMYRFSTRTYLTFSATGVSPEVWKSFAVQEALEHDFLMDGLLSLAALHIAAEKELESGEYVRIALEYQNRALISFREALSHLTAENCNSTFACSVIAMMSTLFSTGCILQAFELLEGIRYVSKTGREWLQTGPFGPVFDLWFLPISSIQDSDINMALLELAAFNDNLSSTATQERQATFTDAISHLHTCFSKDKEMVLLWLAMTGEEFMSGLKRHEPMAILIFLHWGVLLDRLHDEWWVEGAGKRLVEELALKLEEYGQVWVDMTIWARRQVGLL